MRRSAPSPQPAGAAPPETRPGAVETAAPGVAALLDGVGEDRNHAVLDLGTATDPNLRAYSRFARWIRFADVLREAVGPGPEEAGASRLRFEPADRPHGLGPRLLPAEVTRLLPPLRIAHAFALRSGLREYVCIRPAPEPEQPALRSPRKLRPQ